MTTALPPSRGRTAPGRLAALDRFLVHEKRALLARAEGPFAAAPFIDVGFGEHPWTTLEAAAAYRSIKADLQVVGVERAAHRAEAAVHVSLEVPPGVRFVEGSFETLSAIAPPARLIRMMNVLRGYPESEVSPAHRCLGAALVPGGLLVEGSADPTGSLLTCHLLRRADAEGPPRPLVDEGLLFFTDFRHGFAPRQFRDWLPRLYRRNAGPDTNVGGFLNAWTAAWTQARNEAGSRLAPPEAFARSIEVLVGRGAPVVNDAWHRKNGYLVWQAPKSVC